MSVLDAAKWPEMTITERPSELSDYIVVSVSTKTERNGGAVFTALVACPRDMPPEERIECARQNMIETAGKCPVKGAENRAYFE